MHQGGYGYKWYRYPDPSRKTKISHPEEFRKVILQKCRPDRGFWGQFPRRCLPRVAPATHGSWRARWSYGGDIAHDSRHGVREWCHGVSLRLRKNGSRWWRCRKNPSKGMWFFCAHDVWCGFFTTWDDSYVRIWNPYLSNSFYMGTTGDICSNGCSSQVVVWINRFEKPNNGNSYILWYSWARYMQKSIVSPNVLEKVSRTASKFIWQSLFAHNALFHAVGNRKISKWYDFSYFFRLHGILSHLPSAILLIAKKNPQKINIH